uniref:Uncharacterized protein n=1 Tax=Lactuca sativa TaxID=4236 RepID=A0A9R1W5K5_LACSA|nr:hypothetical protein LSAT_V11C300143910 [Lactuca sativa]
MASISSSPCTAEDIFKDYSGRHGGIVRALVHVKNCLRVEVSVMIESGGVSHSMLLSEVETSFYHIDSSHDHSLTFDIRGGTRFSSSKSINFTADISKGPLYVTMEKVMDAFSRAREICIFVLTLILLRVRSWSELVDPNLNLMWQAVYESLIPLSRRTVSMVRVEVQNTDDAIKDDKIVGNPYRDSGTNLILLSDDDTRFMPYRTDNFSNETVIHSYTSFPYAWDEPSYPHRLTVEVLSIIDSSYHLFDDIKIPWSPAGLITCMTHGITSLLSNTTRLGGMGEFLHGDAVLDCCFHDDTSGFSASADNTVTSYIPFTSLRLVFYNEREDLLGRHDAPVRCIEYSYAIDIQVDDENIVPRPSVS